MDFYFLSSRISVQLHFVFNDFSKGVKKIDGEINYLVKLKNETAPQIIHSAELKTLWPMTFIHFLEASLVWVKNPVNEQFNQDGEETTDPIGKPLRVVCKWNFM